MIAARSSAAAVALVFLSACSPPLRVERVKPAVFYRELTRTALSSKDVSDFTRTVLQRHDLLDRYQKEPDQSIAMLRESVVQGVSGQDEIFALTEVSLFRAQRDHSAPNYLAAAVYAYTFLFPDDPHDIPDAMDPRTRVACDMYNRALAQALLDSKGKFVDVRAGVFPLPFGDITLAFDPKSLEWYTYSLVDMTPVGELKIEGMRNIYRDPGVGAPLAARPKPIDGVYSDDDLIGPNSRVPVTLVLRLEHPLRQLTTASLQGALEVHATTDEGSIRIDGRAVPLESEPTSVLAISLASARPWETELAAFLGNALKFKTRPTLLRGAQPYRRGKIPVVFVHGTASSIFRWADMVNDLNDDRRIRQHYQFWFFTYDSGNPIAYSAYRLRELLAEQVQRFDGNPPDPALHQMVVIGHSQGGLLTKMTAIDSGNRFWENISKKPFDQVKFSPKTHKLLQGALFVKPLPFVKCLIFVATPHQGSYLAGAQIVRRLVQRLVSLPADVISVGTELTGLSSGTDAYLGLQRIPTSIDNMDPHNPFIRTLASIPIAPGVKAYSIIPVQEESDIENGGDGVVKYRSAHIDGVETELVVHDSHSTQANPHTVAEVRRILLKHWTSVQPLLATPPAQ